MAQESCSGQIMPLLMEGNASGTIAIHYSISKDFVKAFDAKCTVEDNMVVSMPMGYIKVVDYKFDSDHKDQGNNCKTDQVAFQISHTYWHQSFQIDDYLHGLSIATFFQDLEESQEYYREESKKISEVLLHQIQITTVFCLGPLCLPRS